MSHLVRLHVLQDAIGRLPPQRHVFVGDAAHAAARLQGSYREVLTRSVDVATVIAGPEIVEDSYPAKVPGECKNVRRGHTNQQLRSIEYIRILNTVLFLKTGFSGNKCKQKRITSNKWECALQASTILHSCGRQEFAIEIRIIVTGQSRDQEDMRNNLPYHPTAVLTH